MAFTLYVKGLPQGKTHSTRMAAVVEAYERGLVHTAKGEVWLDESASIRDDLNEAVDVSSALRHVR